MRVKIFEQPNTQKLKKNQEQTSLSEVFFEFELIEQQNGKFTNTKKKTQHDKLRVK